MTSSLVELEDSFHVHPPTASNINLSVRPTLCDRLVLIEATDINNHLSQDDRLNNIINHMFHNNSSFSRQVSSLPTYPRMV